MMNNRAQSSHLGRLNYSLLKGFLECQCDGAAVLIFRFTELFDPNAHEELRRNEQWISNVLRPNFTSCWQFCLILSMESSNICIGYEFRVITLVSPHLNLAHIRILLVLVSSSSCRSWGNNEAITYRFLWAIMTNFPTCWFLDTGNGNG